MPKSEWENQEYIFEQIERAEVNKKGKKIRSS